MIKKGFTLIELLVVIAIIGILSGIVLVSLSSARGKAKDSALESQLASLRSASELYSNNHNGSYGPATDVCTGDPDTTLFTDTASNIINLIAGVQGTVCAATDSDWAVSAPLISDPAQFWCVDSTGASKQVSAALGSGEVVCPTS